MLANIQNILDLCAGDDQLFRQVHRELCDLSDELNSVLSEHYTVKLTHYDTGDYLEIQPVNNHKE